MQNLDSQSLGETGLPKSNCQIIWTRYHFDLNDIFVDFGVYTNANPMLDFDTTKRFDVYVRCSDNKNYDEEQLIVIVKKNAIPDFTNLPSKELSTQIKKSNQLSTWIPLSANSAEL